MTIRYAQTGFDLPALTTVIEEILDEDAVGAEGASWSQIKATFR
jgi:hypothetical protein